MNDKQIAHEIVQKLKSLPNADLIALATKRAFESIGKYDEYSWDLYYWLLNDSFKSGLYTSQFVDDYKRDQPRAIKSLILRIIEDATDFPEIDKDLIDTIAQLPNIKDIIQKANVISALDTVYAEIFQPQTDEFGLAWEHALAKLLLTGRGNSQYLIDHYYTYITKSKDEAVKKILAILNKFDQKYVADYVKYLGGGLGITGDTNDLLEELQKRGFDVQVLYDYLHPPEEAPPVPVAI